MRLLAAAGLSIVAFGAGSSSPQALRTCVDRWNQANMRDWGPELVHVAVRPLTRNEMEHVGEYGRARRCVVDTAAKLGEQELACAMESTGAYACAKYSDGASPLRRENGTLDERGVLKLDAPLAGTHPTAPLPWQRYPHVDGLIHPWTRSGRLRPGLSFSSRPLIRGTCGQGSEYTLDPAALQCYSGLQYPTCYAPSRDWGRGTIVACGDLGTTRYDRFLVTRR